MLWKETAAVRALGLRIPVLLFIGPRVVELDDEGAAVMVPLGWRTKNHVGSMYVGVMAAAADLASGMNAFSLIRSRYRQVVPVFKFANMEFLKRADGDTVFRTGEGRRIAKAMEEAVRTGQRVTLPVEVVATVPSRYGDEPVARFTMGLSVKERRPARP
jgi:acyl-coenzyme A thioesterase PaaI-like protein